MGFLRKLQRQIGWAPQSLMKKGTLARGKITAIDEDTSGAGDGEAVPKVTFTIEVTLDGEAPYTASYMQILQRRFLDQVKAKDTVAVRVDPNDRNEIVIDMKKTGISGM